MIINGGLLINEKCGVALKRKLERINKVYHVLFNVVDDRDQRMIAYYRLDKRILDYGVNEFIHFYGAKILDVGWDHLLIEQIVFQTVIGEPYLKLSGKMLKGFSATAVSQENRCLYC